MPPPGACFINRGSSHLRPRTLDVGRFDVVSCDAPEPESSSPESIDNGRHRHFPARKLYIPPRAASRGKQRLRRASQNSHVLPSHKRGAQKTKSY